jgi:hypothetical protein
MDRRARRHDIVDFHESEQFITQTEFGKPGRYWIRVPDPDSGVTSKPFVLVIKG